MRASYGRPRRGLILAKSLRSMLPSGRLIDIVYSALRFAVGQRRIPRYRKPQYFSDHLFRLRNDRSLLVPLHQFVTDKEYIKHYVASVVGWQYTLRTLAILRTAQQVDGFVPEEFPCVVKPTHLSGEVIVLRTADGRFDRATLQRWLKTNYYRVSREPNYRYLEPKIIVEEFFLEQELEVPRDFKFHCFYGVPRLVQVDAGRFTHHTRNLYDSAWQRVDMEWAYPQRVGSDPRPVQLDLMLSLARQLARSFRYIRIDMYTDDAVVKIGEMTSCPEGAKRRIKPRSADAWLGGMFASEGG